MLLEINAFPGPVFKDGFGWASSSERTLTYVSYMSVQVGLGTSSTPTHHMGYSMYGNCLENPYEEGLRGKVRRTVQWGWEVPCVPWVCPENADCFWGMRDGETH